MVADAIDNARQGLEARLAELRDETQRIEAALAALGGVSGGSATRRRRRQSRPRSASSGNGRRRSGGRRRRAGGTRSEQALELVRTQPGITIPELAERMGIKQNYLYRVLPGLQQDGLVTKQGKGWHPAATSAPESPVAPGDVGPDPY
jgi:hypothetical protein